MSASLHAKGARAQTTSPSRRTVREGCMRTRLTTRAGYIYGVADGKASTRCSGQTLHQSRPRYDRPRVVTVPQRQAGGSQWHRTCLFSTRAGGSTPTELTISHGPDRHSWRPGRLMVACSPQRFAGIAQRGRARPVRGRRTGSNPVSRSSSKPSASSGRLAFSRAHTVVTEPVADPALRDRRRLGTYRPHLPARGRGLLRGRAHPQVAPTGQSGRAAHRLRARPGCGPLQPGGRGTQPPAHGVFPDATQAGRPVRAGAPLEAAGPARGRGIRLGNVRHRGDAGGVPGARLHERAPDPADRAQRSMKQLVIPRYGPPEVLTVREAPDPPVTPGAVRLRVRAAGVNFSDLLARQGLYPDAPKPPVVVGYEASGIVDAVGSGVAAPRKGDRVTALTRFGG